MTEREEKRIKRYLTNVMLGKETEGDYITVKTGKDTTDVKYVERPIPTTLRLKAAELLIKAFSADITGFGAVPVVLCDDLSGGDACGK